MSSFQKLRVNNTNAFQMPKKIALIGTSCVGKTTILNELRKRNATDTRIEFLKEAARIFFQENPALPNRFTPDIQRKIQSLVIQREKVAAEKNVSLIVSDRSVIDPVAYAMSNGDEKEADFLLQTVRNWITTYTTFLVLNPADVPYKNDSIRNEDIFIRQKVHDCLLQILANESIPFLLVSGSVLHRANTIQSVIDSLLY